jgi:vancomycin resistance protein YoaR
VERHPHNQRVNSVAPGLDATVWYGQTDLKIKNDLSEPVQIRCRNEQQSLSITINTSQAVAKPQLALRRREIHTTNQHLLVEVYLDTKDKSPRLISRDSYLTH